MTSEQAAQLIGDLVKRDLGITVPTEPLVLFIRKRWERIAPLSHRVHAEADMTKSQGPLPEEFEPDVATVIDCERDLAELEALGMQNKAALCAREPYPKET